LLAAVFLFQPLSKLLILINYEVNKTSITQSFCVNKRNPKMHCNGKCHLKKQLEKEDQKQNSSPTSLKEKSEIQFHVIPNSHTLQTESSDIMHHFTYLFSFSDSPLLSVFHPPAIA
jgi:hypothetical protein